jgi:Protein of unknown function (DUF1698)
LRKRIIFDLIEQHVGASLAGKECLDFACCSGFWSFGLTDRGASRVVGLDKNPDHIRQARFVQECRASPDHERVTFLREDMLSYVPPEGGFDLVLCLGVMYHRTDPIGGAERVFAATRDVAIIDSSVSELEGEVFELADGKKYPFCYEREVALVPSRAALVQIFRRAGFDDLKEVMPTDTEGAAAYGPSGRRVSLVGKRAARRGAQSATRR